MNRREKDDDAALRLKTPDPRSGNGPERETRLWRLAKRTAGVVRRAPLSWTQSGALTTAAGVGLFLLGTGANAFEGLAGFDQGARTFGLVALSALVIVGIHALIVAQREEARAFMRDAEATMRALAADQRMAAERQAAVAGLLAQIGETLDVRDDRERTKMISHVNTAEIWSRLRAGSSLLSINSAAQRDIVLRKDGAGRTRAFADHVRTAVKIRRFHGATRLSAVNHVYLLPLVRERGRVQPPRPFLSSLASYQALMRMAEANDVPIDLSTVTFFFCGCEGVAPSAVFVGEWEDGTDVGRPFMLEYDSVDLAGAIFPRRVIEERLKETTSPILCAEQRAHVLGLIASADRSFTLAEALDLYGDLVPQLEPFEAVLTAETLARLGLRPTSSRDPGDVIDHGDGSFTIR